MRTTASFAIDSTVFKRQLLAWAQQFREVVMLDSNQYPQKYSSYDVILAVDAFTSIKTDYTNSFDKLREYQQVTGDWLFGYLTYDLKNDVEALSSLNPDQLYFPDLFFFQPKKLFLLKEGMLEVQYLRMCDDEIEADLEDIRQIEISEVYSNSPPKITIESRIPRELYIAKVQEILAHIGRGDIYEANFCMEFFAENAVIEPLDIYNRLIAISEPPFAAFFKNHKHFALCASPERYLKKESERIISQPIKGTARRSTNETADAVAKRELYFSQKERSENIMIVDLVRNDLSKTAQKGTVEVEELCEAYTFKQVHHLISTVVSLAMPGVSPVDIIRTTFPMGSMTGAPKISAMNIIERLEETKRGLYSGSIGYFSPSGDFDFNVVIRSILYNDEEQYVSFSVGSAITSLSDPEKEYQECLLKAQAMLNVLTDINP